MKMIILTAILAASSFSQAASLKGTGRASAAVCKSNSNAFKQDACANKRVQSNVCSVSLAGSVDSINKVSISINGKKLRGSVDRPFQRLSGSTTSNVNFGGLIRGSLTLNVDGRGDVISARVVDVYVNHDRSGQVYDRYRCQNLR